MFDDLKFAWRRLKHSPGFAVVAILTLALAIGANTAVFAVADAVLFRPLPYRNADELHVLRMLDQKTGQRYTLVSYEYVQAITDHHRGLGEVGMFETGPSVLVPTSSGPQSVQTAVVTANYFQVLGIQPAVGRIFGPDDAAGVARIAMISFASWQQRFGRDPQIVGRSVTLGSRTFDVVGVLPKQLMFPSVFGDVPEIVTVMAPPKVGANSGTFYPIVRREPGVTREQAQAEINALITPLAARDPRTAGGIPVLEDVRGVLYPTGQPIMRLLLVAAGLVVLIGCANLANMLLARHQRREREVGLRIALGASRLRLVRPVLFESILIGLAGATLAVIITTLTFDALLRQVPRVAYGNAPVGVDLRVVLLAFAMGILGGLAFAVAPAWRSARFDAQTLLQARLIRGGRRGGRFGRPMVAVQVAVAVVLVFGTLITGRAFLSVLRVPLGFDPDNVLRLAVGPPASVTGLARQDFFLHALETLARRPDVVAIGATGSLPLTGGTAFSGARVAGSDKSVAGIIHVLPGFFEAAGIPILRGRSLTLDDGRNGGKSAVVSDLAAHVMFPNREPLGETFTDGRGHDYVVVGVVANVRHSIEPEAQARFPPAAYALPNEDIRGLSVLVRVRARREAIAQDLTREAAALSPTVPVSATWWADSISALTAYRNPRFQTIVLGSFAALALGLTTLGIVSVVTFLIAMRTRELGVRLALGAAPRSLVALVLRQTLVPVATGLVVGLLATRWLGRLVETQLFKVETRDPVMLAVVAVIVLIAAALAGYLPARHASRVDPLVVLRAE